MKKENGNGESGKRIERKERHLRWVPLGKIRISPFAQRKLRQSWVNYLAQNMDIEKLGNPEVNERDGWFYAMEGQHRVFGLIEWLGAGWEEQQIQCWVTTGLTEEEEAECFLGLNDKLSVDAFEKFRIALTANRLIEKDIERQVLLEGLCISKEKVAGAVRCVGTLRRVYSRSDAATLGRTLRLVTKAFGDSGLEAPVIDGIALLCQRYDGTLDDQVAIRRLGDCHGGVNGLLGMAERLRRNTGNQKSHCVAATAVEIINRGKGVKKLPSWWRS